MAHIAKSEQGSLAPGIETALRIGDVAELTGLTQRTIRYYEELGLLSPATRTQGDYRVFTGEDVERLKRIRELRDVLGFSLAEISKVLQAQQTLETLKSRYRSTEDPGERLQRLDEALRITEEQIALIDTKIVGIHRLREELAQRAERYRARRQEVQELVRRKGQKESE